MSTELTRAIEAAAKEISARSKARMLGGVDADLIAEIITFHISPSLLSIQSANDAQATTIEQMHREIKELNSEVGEYRELIGE